MDSHAIHQIRHFDRFYTQLFRLTDKYHLHTTLTLVEARLLLEIGENQRNTAVQLTQALTIDKGYLSRLLTKLEDRGLLQRTANPADKRTKILVLTAAGEASLATINERADDQVQRLFANLTPTETQQVLDAMATIQAHVQTKPHAE